MYSLAIIKRTSHVYFFIDSALTKDDQKADIKSTSILNLDKKSIGSKMPPNKNDSIMAPISLKSSENELSPPPEIQQKISTQAFATVNPEMPNIKPTKIARNRRKISGCGILSDKTLFLKDEVQDEIVLADCALMEGVVIRVPIKLCKFWKMCWYNESFSVKFPCKYLHTHVPKENARLKQKLFQGCDEYGKVHPCTKKRNQTYKKMKAKQEIKFQHDSAQRAFADLQMSLRPMDSTQLEAASFHCGDKQRVTCSKSDSANNNDSIVDNSCVSEDELFEHGTTFVQNNAMNEYVPDKNYNPEWMEMDRDYRKKLLLS